MIFIPAGVVVCPHVEVAVVDPLVVEPQGELLQAEVVHQASHPEEQLQTVPVHLSLALRGCLHPLRTKSPMTNM